jgi:MFS family permease
MAMEETQPSAFSFREFRFFLGMRIPATLATQVQGVAVGWHVYDISHRPIALGFVGLAQFLPIFGFALIAGHVADRYDRRIVLALCLSLQAMTSFLLLSVVVLHVDALWPIYALLVLFGVGRAFAAPAMQALLPSLIPQALLGSAFAWSSSSLQAMTIAGPALGGIIYAGGPAAVYGTAGVAFTVSAFAALAIRPPLGRVIEQRGMTWSSLLAGIKFIWNRPAVGGAISLDLFAVLFGGATALLPVYARDILHTGPLGLGFLRSAPAVGAVVVGVYLGRHSLGRHAGRTMFAGVAVFGVATIIFGLSASVPLSLAALIMLGAADMVSVFVRQNLVQRATPDAMRGRVNAVNFLFIGASNELGEMESGLPAAWLGSVEAVVVGGIGTLAIMTIWLWRFPQLRAVDRLEDIETPSIA